MIHMSRKSAFALVLLALVTYAFAFSPVASYCTLENGTLLNDLHVTPGKVNPAMTKEKLCDPKFHTSDIRNDAAAWTLADGSVASEGKIKNLVYEHYGVKQGEGICKPDGKLAGCEVDHLISLELGGMNSEANLWPQPYNRHSGAPGAGAKDIVENTLHREVCSGSLTLADAQRRISTNWFTEYTRIQAEKKR